MRLPPKPVFELLLLFFLTFPLKVKAQDYFTSVQHYTTEDGLADNYISDVFQDSKGYLWISTTSGLNRFDGHEFFVYTKEENGLSANYIENITEDRNGKFWIYSRGKWNTDGFAFFTKQFDVFDPVTEEATPLDEMFDLDFEAADMRMFLCDKEKNIWISTRYGSIYKYDGKSLKLICQKKVFDKWWGRFTITSDGRICYLEKDQLTVLDTLGQVLLSLKAPYEFGWIYPGKNEEIILGNHLSHKEEKGFLEFWKLSPGSERLEPFYMKNKESYPIRIKPQDNIYRGFKVDENNRIWTFWDDRFLLFDEKGHLEYEFTDILKQFHIPPRSVFFNFGSDNLFLLSTEKGLISIKLREHKFQDIFEKKVYNIYGGMVDDGTGNILINQNELLKVNSQNEIVSRFPDKYISEIIKDDDGGIWIGDKYSGIHFFDAEKETFETVFPSLSKDTPNSDHLYILSMYMLEDRGELLVGLRRGGLSVFNKKSGELLPFKKYNAFTSLEKFVVNHFYKNEEGIWLATNEGFFLMDEKEGIIAHFKQSENGISFNEVYHFYEDEQGIFWLATNGNGIIKWDRKNKKAHQFTKGEGLSHQRVYAVYEDDYGQLWFPSGYGLMQLNKKTHELIIWLKKDGLPFDDFVYHFHHQMPDGRLYFGGGNGGVMSFYPDSLERPVVPLTISRYLEFDNKAAIFKNESAKIHQTKKIHLNPDISSVQLKMALFDYTAPQNTKYAYKIDSEENTGENTTNWNFQKDNSIRLNNLSYGDHEVQIKAIGTDNERTQGFLSIPVVVEKPIYLKTWFLILAGLSFIGLIAAFFRWRTYALQQDKKRLEAEVSERTKTISQQKEELETANATKDRLFAIIGHDLRGPLFNLQGIEDQFNYLLETGQTERLKELGGKMEKTARYLTDTLNNLLNWSMHQMGTFPYQPEEVYLRKTTENIFALFESTADAKGIELQMEVPSGITAFVDNNAISTVMRNLVSNAIKFTEPGGQIKVNAAAINDSAIINVSDTGIGMTEEQTEKLLTGMSFERKRGTKGERSTGLGLVLVKDLIDQNKGKIKVQSKEGGGTTFEVELLSKAQNI